MCASCVAFAESTSLEGDDANDAEGEGGGVEKEVDAEALGGGAPGRR